MPSQKPATETAALLWPLLAKARSDTTRTWAGQALCAGADPELFFPSGDDPAVEARRICAACAVSSQCLAYAVTAEEPFGVWGGLDPRERQRLRRQLQRREPSADSRTGSAA